MKYKHTPGPWTAFQDYPRRHTVGTATGRICDMWGQDPAFYTDEDEANERLIASAPSLLAALVEIVAVIEAYCDDHDSTRPTDVTVVLPKLRAAIANATQEEEL